MKHTHINDSLRPVNRQEIQRSSKNGHVPRFTSAIHDFVDVDFVVRYDKTTLDNKFHPTGVNLQKRHPD